MSAYASHVMGHMNDDHGDANRAMVRHAIGIEVGTERGIARVVMVMTLKLLCVGGACYQVESAEMVGMDRLGMYVKITSKYGNSKLRLPFPRPVADRKDLKAILVDMTNAAAAAAEA